jgi:drug/metabolite transporter (DMT)-like permease
MIKTVLLVMIAELWASTGHFLFKKSANALGPESLRTLKAQVRFIRNVTAKPAIWAGMLCIAIGLIIWIFALAGGDLSLVYPLSSIEYIIVLFYARFLLNERIDAMKLAGTLLVAFGIIFITMS